VAQAREPQENSGRNVTPGLRPSGRNAAERFAAIERRLAALEAIMAPPAGESEDGQPRRWLSLRDASLASGYSINGLRKLVKRGRVEARYRGAHLIVKVDTIPTRKIG
jgi:hypothetical protein